VMDSGLTPPVSLRVPEPATDEQLLRVHLADYVEKVKKGQLTEREIRRIGFPWSLQMVERSRRSVGGTISTCRAALEEGIAINLAGGTHHAYPDHGEGFCVFNDTAVAARAMQTENRAGRILIIDCDVHQGNGTAAIFAGDPSVFTFSIHGAKNFPFHKENSDLDIALEDGSQDPIYLEALQSGLAQSLQQAHADLAIYLAGADPFAGDRLGRLSLSKAGLAKRDRMVFIACQKARLPVAVVMSGGYAKNIQDTVDIHFQTLKTAMEVLGYGNL
jgi:acetoin utilization deacetylase AcuC-like enzyme